MSLYICGKAVKECEGCPSAVPHKWSPRCMLGGCREYADRWKKDIPTCEECPFKNTCVKYEQGNRYNMSETPEFCPIYASKIIYNAVCVKTL
jgi:hypothetical protein